MLKIALRIASKPRRTTALLNEAAAENKLISVRSLSSPFSAHAEEAVLSYAQSYSVVDFLISAYGPGKMLELLNTFSEGSSYDGALSRVYGFDIGKDKGNCFTGFLHLKF